MRFAHMKRILELNRLCLRGLSWTTVEVPLTATAQNMRRLANASDTSSSPHCKRQGRSSLPKLPMAISKILQLIQPRNRIFQQSRRVSCPSNMDTPISKAVAAMIDLRNPIVQFGRTVLLSKSREKARSS